MNNSINTLTKVSKIAMEFSKDEVVELIKIFIPTSAIVIIAFGAYKNNYCASGKLLGFEFSFSPQQIIV